MHTSSPLLFLPVELFSPRLPGGAVRMRRLWRWYQQCLASHPVRTQVVSSGILWASGDIGAQAVTHYSARRRANNKPVVAAPIESIPYRFLRPWSPYVDSPG